MGKQVVSRNEAMLLLLLAVLIPSVAVAISPAELTAAISAMATIVLVVVTAWYVLLTRQLVGAQNETLAAARQSELERRQAEDRRRERQALVELWRVCHKYAYSLTYFDNALAPLRTDSPDLRENVERSLDSLSEESDEMQAVAVEMTATTPDLPDGDIHALTWEVGAGLQYRASLCTLLGITFRRVLLKALRDGKDLKLKDIETEWTLVTRPLAKGLEWSSLVDNSVFVDLEEPLDRLSTSVFDELRRREVEARGA